MKTVFVKPVEGKQVYFPLEDRFLKPEGEDVPADTWYWRDCQAKGLLTIKKKRGKGREDQAGK